MTIHHIAIWTRHLEALRNFYVHYFGGKCGSLYHNPAKQFESYFISFDDGSKLELMRRADVLESSQAKAPYAGLAHFAFSVGSKEKVDGLTNKLKLDGFEILSEPRTTGDGYYESIVLDPDGNRVEITV
jgi:lactoylglutathione lyase